MDNRYIAEYAKMAGVVLVAFLIFVWMLVSANEMETARVDSEGMAKTPTVCKNSADRLSDLDGKTGKITEFSIKDGDTYLAILEFPDGRTKGIQCEVVGGVLKSIAFDGVQITP